MRERKHYTAKLISLMLLAASATFLIAFFGLRHYYGIDADLYGEVARFREAREAIADRYIGEYDETELTDAAIAAAVYALDDQWSYYMTQEVYEQYQLSMNNQYHGIGISLVRDGETNEANIVSVVSGSPADDAGLEPGDVMTVLEGTPTPELETEEIQQIISDKFGDSVILELRSEAGETREVEVRVDEYYSNPVSYELLEDGVGYIALSNFDGTSGDETLAAIEDLLEQGAEGLIFDVRNNPGGHVSELLMILDYLLPEGEIFVYADNEGNERVETSDEACLEMPMVVLVNENSYSAAEFFGAILQECGWAEIVGMPTTGKGRSQVNVPLSDGSVIHLSTSRYLTPGRVDLSEAGGISPDVELELDPDTEADEQLDAALALLTGN